MWFWWWKWGYDETAGIVAAAAYTVRVAASDATICVSSDSDEVRVAADLGVEPT